MFSATPSVRISVRAGSEDYLSKDFWAMKSTGDLTNVHFR
jgi:hypothetical protein